MREGEHVLRSYRRAKRNHRYPLVIIGNFNSSYSKHKFTTEWHPDRALGIATDSEPLKGCVALVEYKSFDQWWEAARPATSNGNPEQAMKWLDKLIDPETFAPRQGVHAEERGRIGAINILTDALLQSQERTWGGPLMSGLQHRRKQSTQERAKV